jgi:hypothetical protein
MRYHVPVKNPDVRKSAIPTRTSFIFYLGLEGIGGLDMETNEDENVCS